MDFYKKPLFWGAVVAAVVLYFGFKENGFLRAKTTPTPPTPPSPKPNPTQTEFQSARTVNPIAGGERQRALPRGVRQVPGNGGLVGFEITCQDGSGTVIHTDDLEAGLKLAANCSSIK